MSSSVVLSVVFSMMLSLVFLVRLAVVTSAIAMTLVRMAVKGASMLFTKVTVVGRLSVAMLMLCLHNRSSSMRLGNDCSRVDAVVALNMVGVLLLMVLLVLLWLVRVLVVLHLARVTMVLLVVRAVLMSMMLRCSPWLAVRT